MSERKLLVRAYYRSLTPDGEIWCEGRDPAEVREMSRGMDCTFEVMRFYETTEGWEPWDTDTPDSPTSRTSLT